MGDYDVSLAPGGGREVTSLSRAFGTMVARLQASFRQLHEAEHRQRTLVHELQTALTEVKTLRGILPICSSCKRIREGDGRWQPVESYVREHSAAEFTHGLCPECAQRDWGSGTLPG
jgi:hypothetical protein